MSCEYDNAVYAEVSEKPAAKEFTISENALIPSNTGSKGRSEGDKNSCNKKLLLMLFLVVLALMLGTVCTCVAFGLKISNLEKKLYQQGSNFYTSRFQHFTSNDHFEC